MSWVGFSVSRVCRGMGLLGIGFVVGRFIMSRVGRGVSLLGIGFVIGCVDFE